MHARVVDNAIGAVEPNIEAIFPSLFPSFVGGPERLVRRLPAARRSSACSSTWSRWSRHGNYFVLYGNLRPGAADPHRERDRHRPEHGRQRRRLGLRRERVAPPHPADGRAQPGRRRPTRAMIGADACCTVDDEQQERPRRLPRHASTWSPRTARRGSSTSASCINGAHTLIDEKVLLEDAGGETRFQTRGHRPGAGRGGAGRTSTSRRASPSVGPRPLRRRGHARTGPFTGDERARCCTGTTAPDDHRRVRLRPVRQVRTPTPSSRPPAATRSRSASAPTTPSPTASPPAGTPALGNRNIPTDGHFAVIQLTTTR